MRHTTGRHNYTPTVVLPPAYDRALPCEADHCLYVAESRDDLARHAAEPGECPRRPLEPSFSVGIATVARNGHQPPPTFRAPRGEYCRGCNTRDVPTLAGLCGDCAPSLHAAVARALPDARQLSPTFAPALLSGCACRGCWPLAADDGRRPRIVMLGGQENTAAVLPMRHRRSASQVAAATAAFRERLVRIADEDREAARLEARARAAAALRDADTTASGRRRRSRAKTGRRNAIARADAGGQHICSACRKPGHSRRTCLGSAATLRQAEGRAASAMVEYGEHRRDY